MSHRVPDIPPDTLRRARRGDEDALEQLVRSVYPAVSRWALVHTGDPSDAQDLTQDVLIRMIRSLRSFKGQSAFATWLYAMTRNAATDRARRGQRATRLEKDPRTEHALAPDAAPATDAAVRRGELAEALSDFFDVLPPRQRQVLDLVDLQGVPAAEVAELLGLAPSSVRVSLLNARRSMRSRILEMRPDLAEDLR